MKNLTIPLLVLLVSGGLWAQNPEQAVYEYFDFFNNSDFVVLNRGNLKLTFDYQKSREIYQCNESEI